MSIELVTIIMFGILLILLLSGLPIVFSLGGSATITIIVLKGVGSLNLLPFKAQEAVVNFVLLAIPLFIFMANMLQRSGIADDLYEAVYRWAGSLRGGLAMGTVVICGIMGAMCAVSAAGTITMGLIAIPSMMKRGYDKIMSVGTVAAGGALGQLIPPGTIFIILGINAGISIGRLFAGGAVAGVTLVILFCLYIGIRGAIQPQLCPILPVEERAGWREKLISLKAVILPVGLITLVLGSIFMGVTTITEAASAGAFGSIVCAAIHRRLTWQAVKESLHQTARLSSMILWIIIAGMAFNAIYSYIGASEFVASLLSVLPGGRWGTLIGIQVILLFLGCLLEPAGIVMITTPIFFPIITNLGFDPIWFGVIFVINMEMGYITPPVGFNIFYLRAIVPKDVTIMDIYRSIIPFVILSAIGLAILIIFPQIILWLPNILFGK